MPFPWLPGSWGSSSWGESWGEETPTTPPVTSPTSGLRHFRAAHFSKLRHFFSAQFAGIEVEIEIKPQIRGGSTAAGWAPYVPTGRYTIVVRIKRKGEEWESVYDVNALTASTVKSVVATALKVGKSASDVSVKVKDFSINITKPIVKVFQK